MLLHESAGTHVWGLAATVSEDRPKPPSGHSRNQHDHVGIQCRLLAVALVVCSAMQCSRQSPNARASGDT